MSDNPFVEWFKREYAKFDHHHQEGAVRRNQNFTATFTHWYEAPSGDSSRPDLWCYTDRLSYAPGDIVSFHLSGSVSACSLTVVRDGADPTEVHVIDHLAIECHPTPPDAYAVGCGWPVAATWQVPDDLPSGFYLVIARSEGAWRPIEQHHGFVVRAAPDKAMSRTLLICATSTWIAYNDWGGANAYEGIAGDNGDRFSPVLSIERPFARGLIWLPAGAPRFSADGPLRPGDTPRYPSFEYGFANGFAKYFAAAGWAQFERHFVIWAEQNGYQLDYATQHDLHYTPEILASYDAVVIVGHDEYWTWEMRDAVERYVEDGGKLARFAGNFLWQVRLEDEGRRQICYKWDAHDCDPVRTLEDVSRLTSSWDDPFVGRPAVSTMGLSSSKGGYVRVGCCNPRWPGGYVVYRPEHWAFAQTDLYYGDMFGQDARIFSYEVDGADYEMRDGRPFPVPGDGPEILDILAMGPATSYEDDHQNPGAVLFIAKADVAFKALAKFGDTSPETLRRAGSGVGMMAHFAKGQGEVFNAGSCEWVVGLQHGDFYTAQVTRNVLDRFLLPNSLSNENKA